MLYFRYFLASALWFGSCLSLELQGTLRFENLNEVVELKQLSSGYSHGNHQLEEPVDGLRSVKGSGDDLKWKKKTEDVKISDNFYNRLVYFSKACALTSCITDNLLIENRSFDEGACPSHIKFCTDPKSNPAQNRTRVEMVLSADRGQLGTGYVIVDHERNVMIIAFRGSSTRQDWFSDFQIYPVEYEPSSIDRYDSLVKKKIVPKCENCKIHRGFYRFKETLGPVFLDKVEAIFNKYPNYNAVVTGHSLGAAMASMVGIELKLRGYNPTVITYATPRMFNKNMREWLDTLFKTEQVHQNALETGILDSNTSGKGGYFRVIHNQDYIPMVPPFYEAAGVELFINKIELPHLKEDIEYRGPKKTYFDDGITLNTVNRVEDWLHTYEHRAYFVLIEGCANI